MRVAPPGTLAAEYLPDLGSLSTDQRATFRIGQIVRFSVIMEQTTRDVHAFLHKPHLTKNKRGPRPFAQLVEATQTLIATSGLPFAQTAHRALDDVYSVYAERNRFVHDLVQETELGVWSRERVDREPSAQSRQIDERSLEDAVLDIVRAQWRLHGLAWLVSFAPSSDTVSPSSDDAIQARGWTHILAGRFQLTEGGGVRTSAG